MNQHHFLKKLCSLLLSDINMDHINTIKHLIISGFSHSINYICILWDFMKCRLVAKPKKNTDLILTLSLLMSYIYIYIYGAPSKAKNLTSYIYIYLWTRFFTGDFAS
jgi:hypothetical protein